VNLVTSDGLTLEAVLDEPDADATGAVVLCHPHPQMGGSMHAPFLEVVAGALCRSGLRVLRFNTRGTGGSEGAFGGGTEETKDLEAAWNVFEGTPKALAGWSFGARLVMAHAAQSSAPAVLFAPVLREGSGMTPLARPRGPVLPVVGARDQFVSPAAVEEFFGVAPVVLPGCDHFFIGRFGEQAAEAAAGFLTKELSPATS